MFKLEFKTDNAAFDDEYPENEIARILREVHNRVYEGASAGPILDSNGNTVGLWELTED